MGHEFIELRDLPKAINAYNTAVSHDEKDYRAWYGLG